MFDLIAMTFSTLKGLTITAAVVNVVVLSVALLFLIFSRSSARKKKKAEAQRSAKSNPSAVNDQYVDEEQYSYEDQYSYEEQYFDEEQEAVRE